MGCVGLEKKTQEEAQGTQENVKSCLRVCEGGHWCWGKLPIKTEPTPTKMKGVCGNQTIREEVGCLGYQGAATVEKVQNKQGGKKVESQRVKIRSKSRSVGGKKFAGAKGGDRPYI